MMVSYMCVKDDSTCKNFKTNGKKWSTISTHSLKNISITTCLLFKSGSLITNYMCGQEVLKLCNLKKLLWKFLNIHNNRIV